MKNLLVKLLMIVLGAGMLGAAGSCSKDPLPIRGHATAVLNGEIWKPTGWAGKTSSPHPLGVTIAFGVHSSEGFYREELNIYRIPRSVGIYPITSAAFIDSTDQVGATYDTFLDDGDVMGDRWKVPAEEQDGFVEITHYDAATGEMRGNFQVTLKVDTVRGRNDPDRAAILLFTEGNFQIFLEE